jgi:hypothetical protein
MAAVQRGDGLAFVGWLGMLLILGAIAAVMAGTSRRPAASIVCLAAAVAIEIVVAALIAGFTDFPSALELAAIAGTWTLLWSVIAWALRRRGAGIACTGPLLAAMILFASPVVAMPVVRAAGVGTPTQRGLIRVIATSSPVFACLDVVKPRIRIDWAELPGMYAMSGLGQEVPMELPNGWTTAAIYAGVTLTIFALSFFVTRITARRSSTKLPAAK